MAMNIKTLAIVIVAALCFATLMLFLLIGNDYRGVRRQSVKAATVPVTFSGKLDIRSMTNIWAAGRRVVLCGVSFNKPAAMEPLVREQARHAFQGTEVDCVQVGGGTPCDGRAAVVFEGAPVVQCRSSDGSDIAGKFSGLGYLCDVPAQSGGAYNAC